MSDIKLPTIVINCPNKTHFKVRSQNHTFIGNVTPNDLSIERKYPIEIMVRKKNNQSLMSQNINVRYLYKPLNLLIAMRDMRSQHSRNEIYYDAKTLCQYRYERYNYLGNKRRFETIDGMIRKRLRC